MAQRKLYETPILDLNELFLGSEDVLTTSITGGDGGFIGEDYDLADGKWW
jgi:hypothetical protein